MITLRTRALLVLVGLSLGVAGATAACSDAESRAAFVGPDAEAGGANLPDGSSSDAGPSDATPVITDVGTAITCAETPCIMQLSAGRAHVCARTDQGRVECWGANEHGQLGRGARADAGNDKPLVDCAADGGTTVSPYRDAGVVPAYAAAPGTVDVTADLLAAGSDTTCVKTKAKTVECWGADKTADIPAEPLGAPRSSNAVPRRVGCLPEVKAISVGKQASCAVLLDGSLRCWGTLWLEALSTYFPESEACPLLAYCAPSPFPLSDGFTFDTIVQRKAMFLGRSAKGDLVTWGASDVTYPSDLPGSIPGQYVPLNLTGRLGSNAAALVRDVVPLPKITSLSIADKHACVVSDGRVMCWGFNDDGAIGRNSIAESRHYFQPVEALLPADARATSVAVGDRNTCARASDGRVFCWGDNSSGQLGTKRMVVQSGFPLAVEGLPDLAVDVVVMENAACALLKNGTVACWGSHASGQLGDPSLAVGPGPHATPVKVRF